MHLNFARSLGAPEGADLQAGAGPYEPPPSPPPRRSTAAEAPPTSLGRPRTRGECAAVARPCPFTSCRFSLGAGTTADASCALDVADNGGMTLDQLAEVLHVDRERVRAIEAAGLKKVYRAMRHEWRGHGHGAEVDVRMIVYRVGRDR